MSGEDDSDVRVTRNGHRLVRDPHHGFWRVTPTPTSEEIDRYYASEFYSSRYQGMNNSALAAQTADLAYHEAHWEDLCEGVAAALGRPFAGLEVLDIGCGWGQALLHFRARGASCHGLDPATEAVAHARSLGLDVVHAGMGSMEAFAGWRFDVVTLLNVLEHLADPVASITAIASSLLRPGGVLAVEVPNDFNAFQDCATRLHDVSEWWVSPPAHLNYFDRGSLTSLLAGAGLDVRQVEATFPLELFLLFGQNYLGDPGLGRSCHEKRMAFESNLRRHGHGGTLRTFYRALAEAGLGRQVIAYAVKPGGAGA